MPVNQEVGHLEEGRFFHELGNRITTIVQIKLVFKRDRRARDHCVGKSRIKYAQTVFVFSR